ncbi:hypothetical protein E1B28_002402 [Marasmius oreades]|uniref:Uncharacterized protein n=1 Tax=Marasmius oreades TaxID=181124 RepID=A0A9P7UNX3_9AGAR|nr:uncharacterized protein E1B28_002402 [Marasmius oreades]KAG7086449.1 hypothetical protein E1B28_002402 [Marasmius oreades]
MSTANGPARKRLKLTSENSSAQAAPIQRPAEKPENEKETSASHKKGKKSTSTRRRLVAPRPFPVVAKSVSATGPRSGHHEKKNYISITRKTSLSTYMRRCKDLVLKNGYKTLYLSAMGAAIPHLLRLTSALPPILPYASNEIQAEVTTSTTQVMDEIIPDDEDEDIEFDKRSKSTLMATIKIRGGDQCHPPPDSTKSKKRKRGTGGSMAKCQDAESGSVAMIVLEEPEQVDMEMV